MGERSVGSATPTSSGEAERSEHILLPPSKMKRVRCEKLKVFCEARFVKIGLVFGLARSYQLQAYFDSILRSKIMEGWPSGLRRRSCPPEAGPPLAEKPVRLVVV